jgi:DNA-directed RNA polymerase beta subunit
MIIILNITSKFVNFRFSKSVERYLKYTFSKQILIFAIAWMGTRDIYISLIVTASFIMCFDYLFNEDSVFCCLPNSIIENLKKLDDDDAVAEEDVKKAQEIVEKYENQKLKKENTEENKLLAF